MVVGEVERARESGELANIVGDCAGEIVGGEVELEEVFQFRPNSRRNLAGELVSGQNQALQLLAVLEGFGDRSGEGIV